MHTAEVRFVSPVGVLGVGFPRRSFAAAMATDPHVIAVDAGSADWGPYYLGSGQPWAGYHQTRRDLEILVCAAVQARIPLLVGTAGMSGSDAAVDWTCGIVREIAAAHDLRFMLAAIYAEQRPEWILAKLRGDELDALDGAPALTEGTIERSSTVVAMMGPEPFQEAVDRGADIVIAGRASDAAVHAAMPLALGVPPEVAWHMGKIVECGSAIAPDTGECVVGTITQDSFTVTSARETGAVTESSVAVHMLYENPSPHVLREPPGILRTDDARYEDVGDGSVRVGGATFEPQPYSVRLEGVALDGYRSIAIVGVRDPVIVDQIELFTERVTDLVQMSAKGRYGLEPHEYTLSFRRYGYDGVLGALEPMVRERNHPGAGESGRTCYEIGLVAEAVAPTQELATELLNGALPYIMHGVQVPGSCHGANVAFPYAPTVLPTGPVYNWTHWHAARIDDPLEPFRIELSTVGAVEAHA